MPSKDDEVAGIDLLGTVGEHAHGPDGELGAQLAPPGLLVLIPAGEDDIAAVGHGVQQLHALGGMGLHVVVHEQDKVAASLPQTGHNGVVLPGVLGAVDSHNAVIFGAELPDGREGAVGRAVVHEDKLVVVASGLKLGASLLDHGADHLLGVIAGNDNGNQHRVPFSGVGDAGRRHWGVPRA